MQAIEKKYCGEYKIGEFYEGAVKTNKKPIPLTAAICIVNDRKNNELVLGNYLVAKAGKQKAVYLIQNSSVTNASIWFLPAASKAGLLMNP